MYEMVFKLVFKPVFKPVIKPVFKPVVKPVSDAIVDHKDKSHFRSVWLKYCFFTDQPFIHNHISNLSSYHHGLTAY